MREQIYTLPSIIDDGRCDSYLELLDEVRVNSRDVILNFEKVAKITAPGWAILNCISDSVFEHRRDIETRNIFLKKDLKKHIEKILGPRKKQIISMNEMSFEDDENLISGAVCAIAPSFVEKIDQKYFQLLSEEKKWYVRLMLNELMQNSVDHSTSERYFFYAGINDGDFLFGVCDMGVSIPAKLEQKYAYENDQAYLLKSLELGIGTRRVRSGGLGLNHMFEILKKQKGRLVIISRNAQLRKYFARRKTQTSKLKHALRGTWCMAQIPIEGGLK